MILTKTSFVRFWSGLVGLLLPALLLAQQPSPTSPTVDLPTVPRVLFDSEGYPLLYNNNTITTTPIAIDRTSRETPPDNPRDILVSDPFDLSGGHTTVNDQGQVINSYTASCPKLLVDVNMPFIQSCIASTAVVTYCNHGGEDADDVYIEVQLDSNLQLDSAAVPYTTLSAHHYRLQIGTVAAGVCGNVNLHLTTACDPNLLGQSHCIDAHIYPDTLCAAVQPRALLDVYGQCLGNQVQFTVKNHGTPLSPSHQAHYIIIEDHLIVNGQRLVLQQGTLSVANNGKFTTTVPITSPTHMDYKMEIRDAQNTIIAIAFVELCSTNPSIQAISSNYYVYNYWNGSHVPFTDQGCAVNGKTVVNASIGNSNTTSLASDENDNNNSSDEEDDITVEDLHLQTPVNLNIAPNPVGAQAILKLQGAKGVAYLFELYSMTGQRVERMTLTENNAQTLERKALPAGLYVYRISAKGQPLQEGKIIMK